MFEATGQVAYRSISTPFSKDDSPLNNDNNNRVEGTEGKANV